MILRLRAFAASALLAWLAPVAASAAIPVAIYPPHGAAGVSSEALDDVQSLVESALRAGSRRGVLVPARPLLLPASCGQPGTDACLAKLAGSGRVLQIRVKVSGGVLVVTMALVDGAGARTSAVGFGMDPSIMSSLPAQQALAALETMVEDNKAPSASAAAGAVKSGLAAGAVTAGAAGAATAGRSSASTAASSTAASPGAAPAPKPDLRVSDLPTRRAVLAVREPGPPAATPWQATAGKWTAAGGLGLIAAGAAVAFMNKQLADDLTKKSGSNGLRPSDSSSYDKVDTYNTATAVLFVAGGVAVATGVTLWAIAPSADGGTGRRMPPRAGVQGRF
jgi:hypothetical protein